MILTKDNFDLDNMRFSSESTIEHDDSEYDHWELIVYLPKSLSREEIEKQVEQIIINQIIVSRAKSELETMKKSLIEFPNLKDLVFKTDWILKKLQAILGEEQK